MKLRALSCNKTLLRKDILRFAPLWAIYLTGGLLVMLTTLANLDSSRGAYELSTTMGPFAVLNMIYAVLAAQVLFGDLYKTRMCYALHALPMRRETWFCTHVVAGILYSVVPHLIAAIFFLPMLGQYGWVALAWVAVMLMEYLFSFGLAVFCVFCTGNRFAQVAVYAILNFLSLIVYWFVTVIYQPMLYGVQVSEDIFALLCPVVKLAGNTQMLNFDFTSSVSEHFSSSSSLGIYQESQWVYTGVGEGWGYLGICAGIGVGLLVCALLLYRRRALESAGEFIAINALKPVFSVVFALCIACIFAMLGQAMTDGYLLFLVVGLTIGWLGGQMLLQRTVRVFKGKTFLRLGILGLALALTVGLTAWDPVGITRYVPKAENVQSVEFTQGFRYGYSPSDIIADDEGNIEDVIQIHKKILEERGQYSDSYRTITLIYTMKGGRQVVREYEISPNSRAWIKIQNLYNKPEHLLGATEWVKWYNSVNEVHFNGYEVQKYALNYNETHKPEESNISAHTMKTELLMAVFEDAMAGNIGNDQYVDKDYRNYVGLSITREGGYRDWKNFYIPEQAENCQKWMEKYEAAIEALDTY